MTTIHIDSNDFKAYARFRKILEEPGENKGTFVTSGIRANSTISTYLHSHGYSLHPRVTKNTRLLIVANDPLYQSSNLEKALKIPECIIVKEYDMKTLFWNKTDIDKVDL